MIKLNKNNLNLVNNFFQDIKFYMAKTALEGYMGEVWVDNIEKPEFSFVFLERLCFIDGNCKSELAQKSLKEIDEYYKVIIADEEWFELIEKVYKNNFEISSRYSMKKDTKFNKRNFEKYIEKLDSHYEIRKIDKEMYNRIQETDSYVTNLGMSEQYEKNGIGFCALNEDEEIIAVITSDGIFNGGIDVNIKVKDTYRRKGIATAISAKMILECISKGLYPSWDAANLNSVGLAQKLGYELDSEYRIYKINQK